MGPDGPPAPPPRPRPARARARISVAKGATVQVLAGPFEGKTGIVQELDGKGGARVVLGTMSSWVPVAELTEDCTGRERPPFRSSHRKPKK